MTVEELIKKLQEYPKETIVYYDYDDGYSEILIESILSSRRDKNGIVLY